MQEGLSENKSSRLITADGDPRGSPLRSHTNMGPRHMPKYVSHSQCTTNVADALLPPLSSHSNTLPESDLSRGPYTNCVPVGVTDAPTNLARFTILLSSTVSAKSVLPPPT